MPGKMKFLQPGQPGKWKDFEESNGWKYNTYTLQEWLLSPFLLSNSQDLDCKAAFTCLLALNNLRLRDDENPLLSLISYLCFILWSIVSKTASSITPVTFCNMALSLLPTRGGAYFSLNLALWLSLVNTVQQKWQPIWGLGFKRSYRFQFGSAMWEGWSSLLKEERSPWERNKVAWWPVPAARLRIKAMEDC